MIPVMAGVSGMAPVRFLAANITSAIIWAPAHILPGAVAGLGLSLVGHASMRLVVLVGIIFGAGFAIVLLIRLMLTRGVPALEALRLRLIGRLRKSGEGRVSTLAMSLLAPSHDLQPLILIGVPLAFVAAALATLAQEVAERSGLAVADQSISLALSHLRTEPGDKVVAFLTGFGDAYVIIASSAAVTCWLLLRRQWHLALGVVLSIAIASGLATLLKAGLAIPRPQALYEGAQVFGFPSGHATGAATLMGLLTWFAWFGLPQPWRRVMPMAFAAVVGIIAASRLYLSAHWPSDVVGGMLLGTGLTLCFALAFRRVDLRKARPGMAIALALFVFLGFGAWHSWRALPQAVAMYTPPPTPVQVISRDAWLTADWQTLPVRRTDLVGETEEPFSLQWTGTSTAFEAAASTAGWVRADGLTLQTLPRYLDPAVSAEALPVIPRLQDGQFSVLTMVRPAQDGKSREVLRLWKSNTALSDTGRQTPILLVSVETEVIRRAVGMINLPVVHEVAYPSRHDLRLTGTLRRREDGQPVLLAPADSAG
ncbi:phosphatase PAP2 family protein [Vreelandella maris]|uniref:phosphatase PAP2 family protein n=1 Tax=Vreelandella maris TaxID=2729617 RepID=UPI0015944202